MYVIKVYITYIVRRGARRHKAARREAAAALTRLIRYIREAGR